MSENLKQLKCIPCRKNTPPLQPEEINHLLKSIPDWKVVPKNGINQLQRNFVFKDFNMALAFTNEVGEIAEREDHHPAILTVWGSVTVTWWTHIIKGLHRNDFILAAKADEIYAKDRKRNKLHI